VEQQYSATVTPLTRQEVEGLVFAWTRRLVLFARQWTDSAEDVVQEVFLELFRLQTRPADVVAWLFKATRRTAISSWRSETARVRREKTVAMANPEWFQSLDENRLDSETAKKKLQELPSEFREVVVARLWGELTFEQIAVLTDSTRETSRRRYHEAIELLGNRLGIEKSDGQN